MKLISTSGNIALYPSLVLKKNGGLACSWYEYASPDKPAPSDIWFAQSDAHNSWTKPINVSRSVSYNNGPSLHWCSLGFYLIAWHSWRKPGREPFSADGDICNIWVSKSEDGLQWTEPSMAFPRLSNNEYATLTETVDQSLWMVFFQRSTRSLFISSSKDGLIWKEPAGLPEPISLGKFPDLAIDIKGTFYLAYIGNNGIRDVVRMALSNDGRQWCDDHEVFGLDNVDLSKPRVSVAPSGSIWIACQNNEWGSYVAEYIVRTTSKQITINVHADKTPGNALWVLNAVDIRDPAGAFHKLYTFGPRREDMEEDAVQITDDDCEYNSRKGFGFVGKVNGVIRELGDRITRSYFCSDEPGRLIIDLQEGVYTVKIYYSSHIAALPGTVFDIEGDILNFQEPSLRNEKCYICRVDLADTKHMELCPGNEFDNNRPSKILHIPEETSKYIAWTRFTPGSTGIAVARIDDLIPEMTKNERIEI